MSDAKELLLIVVLCVAALVACFAIVARLEAYSCNSKWSRSGFETDYGPVQGCLISKDGKTWIPDENYRDVP